MIVKRGPTHSMPSTCWWCAGEGWREVRGPKHGTAYVIYDNGTTRAFHEHPCLDHFLLSRVGRKLARP